MPDPNHLRAAECRRAVRDYLAERNQLAFEARAIRTSINRSGGDWSEDEVLGALVFLVALGQATGTRDDLGSAMYYQATPAGVLAHERGE